MLNSFNLVYDELTKEQPMNNHIPVNLGIKSDGAPINYDYKAKPHRQDFGGLSM